MSLFLALFSSLFLLVFMVVPNIRTGISQLSMASNNSQNFTISFITALPDSTYNQLVAVSYVYDYTPINGIHVNATCPSSNSSQSHLQCQVTSNNKNKNNIVYMTYVVSDQPTFLCGTFTTDFILLGGSSKIQQRINIKVVDESNGLTFNNVGYVNFLPYISGLSSLDSDFSLQFGDNMDFNVITGLLNIDILIAQFHQKNITVTFGYLIFDASQYTVSVFQNLTFVPTDIKPNLLYAINHIKSNNQSSTRLLQTIPLPFESDTLIDPSLADPYSFNSTSPNASSLVHNPITAQPQLIDPSIASKNIPAPNNSSSGSIIISSKNISTPSILPTGSLLAKNLRSGNFNADLLRIKPTTLNQYFYNKQKQSDGVVDTANLSTASLQLLKSVTMTIDNNSSFAMSSSSSLGQDNQVFNDFFNTNGFVVLSTSTSVDQIYFFQMTPVTDINILYSPSAQSAQPSSFTHSALSAQSSPSLPSIQSSQQSSHRVDSPVYYKSTVGGGDVKPNCSGVLVKVMERVDYLQLSFSYKCVVCSRNEYFDYAKKVCIVFPSIFPFCNINDNIKF